jgi:hypothetical protein
MEIGGKWGAGAVADGTKQSSAHAILLCAEMGCVEISDWCILVGGDCRGESVIVPVCNE